MLILRWQWGISVCLKHQGKWDLGLRKERGHHWRSVTVSKTTCFQELGQRRTKERDWECSSRVGRELIEHISQSCLWPQMYLGCLFKRSDSWAQCRPSEWESLGIKFVMNFTGPDTHCSRKKCYISRGENIFKEDVGNILEFYRKVKCHRKVK